MTSFASSSEKTLVSSLRIYDWNERVHYADACGDVMVLVVKNKFTLNDFPKKLEIPDRASHMILRNFLVYYGFFEYSDNIMLDQGINLSYPISVCPELNTMVSRNIWKDMVIFDRKDLASPDFGSRILESFDKNLFMYTKHLGQQISKRIRKNYPSLSGRSTSNRLVIMVEIYRSRDMDINVPKVIYEYGRFTSQGTYVNHGSGTLRRRRDVTLRSCLPINPFEKLPVASYDPYYKLAKYSMYNQFRRLVTEPDPSIDKFCPDKDQDLIWKNLGFIRARMYTIYVPEDTDRVLQFFRNRHEGLFNASYPFELMSAMEPSGFKEVKSCLPSPVIKTRTKCVICHCRLDPDFEAVFETFCPIKSHVFHTDCWSTWFLKKRTCPICRAVQ